ncbi:MAG: shikimate kinase [Pseudonocardiales bacterium]|nr:shikimate kinase [Jatrophihabitans sp.]MDT4905467.1 shikimate kinase [Pseudonocardiales bacterium]
MTPKVVLVGLPGAGKSTSGRRLAKILAVPFADSDDLVEAATGRGVRAIFAESGEDAFRALEAAAVTEALTQFDGVLALGGGALTTPATRAALQASGAPVVVLRATLETLGDRIGDGRSRPLLTDDPPARLAALAEQRKHLYDEIAAFTVDTDGRTPGQVAATVAARLHDREVRT